MTPRRRDRSAGPTVRTTALLIVLGVAGCAHQAPGPADTVDAFTSAVEREDYDAAYGLMAADYRKRVSAEAFRASFGVAAGDSDTKAAGRALREAARKTPLRVELALDLGEKLPLIKEAGGWRLEAQPLDAYHQGTPRAALRSFLRALALRRYDVALRFVPARYRASVTEASLRTYWEGARREENAKVLATLRANFAAPIVELGDEAHMPYRDREVHFVREDGQWKIEDLD